MIHFFSVKLVNLSVIFVPVPLCKQMRTWSSFLSILLYSKYLQSNFEVPGPLRSLSWGVSFTVLIQISRLGQTVLHKCGHTMLHRNSSNLYFQMMRPELHNNKRALVPFFPLSTNQSPIKSGISSFCIDFQLKFLLLIGYPSLSITLEALLFSSLVIYSS